MVGRVSRFIGLTLLHSFTPPIFLRLVGKQMMRIGYYSLPVVGLTAFFTGGVLALQTFIGGSRLNAEGIVSNIVVLGITRELGPVLAGLMVAGRVSAAIAAEIGTMRVTEQIDAITTMGVNHHFLRVFKNPQIKPIFDSDAIPPPRCERCRV